MKSVVFLVVLFSLTTSSLVLAHQHGDVVLCLRFSAVTPQESSSYMLAGETDLGIKMNRY